MFKRLLFILLTLIPSLILAQEDALSPELEKTVDSLKQVLSQTHKDSILKKIDLLESIAKPYRIKESNTALEYLNQALKLAQAHDLKLKIANLNSEIGQIYIQKDDQYKAIQHFNLAAEIMKRLPKEELNYFIYIDIGNVYYAEKLYDAAIPYYQQALAGFQEKKDSNGINLAYRNIGISYNYLNQTDSARYYYFKALDHIKDHQLEEKGIVYNYIAISYNKDKDYVSAIKWVKKAISLDLSSTTQAGFNSPSSLFNLGLYYESSEQLDSAMFYYKQAEAAGFSNSVNTVSMAVCYTKLKEYEQALNLLSPWTEDSAALASIHIFDQQVVLQTLIKIYEAKGQLKKALTKAKELEVLMKKRIKDKPISSPLLKFSKATANIQKDYEIQQKEAEANYQKELNKQQARLNNIYFWGIILLAGVLLILVYLFWKIRKSNQEIQSKNEIIAQNNRQLAAFNQTQTKLFSIIAHDLRTPFSQLIGFSEQILGQGPEQWSSTQQKVKTMGSSARQAYFLFEDLLGWARTQTGDLNTQTEKLYLPELIKKAKAPLKGLLESKNIQLHIIQNNINWLDADPYMLQTILRNILSNAIRYSPRGSNISIQLSKKGARAVFKIKDQGRGIPEEAMNTLFDEEKWIHSKSNSGLGLVLCKEFVEAHQGEIKAYNQDGAVFEFDLPLATGDLPNAPFEHTKEDKALAQQTAWDWTEIQDIELLAAYKDSVANLEIYDATTIAKLKQELEKLEFKVLYKWVTALEEAAYAFEEEEFERLKQLFLSKITS
jgi:signal transduction histidine kinase